MSERQSLCESRRLNVWDEPLSENERAIIERILANGEAENALLWLKHLLKVYDAREASRA